MTNRGIDYWESADRSERRLLFAADNHLQAIDARTGRTFVDFGDSGSTDLREGLGRDPNTLTLVQSANPGRIFEDLLILGSAPNNPTPQFPTIEVPSFPVLSFQHVTNPFSRSRVLTSFCVVRSGTHHPAISYFEFRFSRKSRGFSCLHILCHRLSSPVLCFQQLTHSFRKYRGCTPDVRPLLGSVVVAALGATRSKMAPSTLGSHIGVTR